MIFLIEKEFLKKENTKQRIRYTLTEGHGAGPESILLTSTSRIFSD